MCKRISIIALSLLIITVSLLSGCTSEPKLKYNNIKSMAEPAPLYIEGTYSKEIDATIFKEQTGLRLEQCSLLSEEDLSISYKAHYDNNDKILNMRVNIHQTDGSNDSTYITMHSDTIWSDRSYSPIDYVYTLNRIRETYINGISVVLGHHRRSKSDHSLTDIYTASMFLNEINIGIEMHTNDREKFQQFIEEFIYTNSSHVRCQIIFNRPMEETNSINLNEEETQLLLVKLNNTPIRYSASTWNGFRESHEYQFAIIIQDSRTGVEYANIIIRENGLLNVSNTVYRITQRHAQEELIAHLKTICNIFE